MTIDHSTAVLILDVARQAADAVCRVWQCEWAYADVAGDAIEAAVRVMRSKGEVQELRGYLYRVCARASARTLRQLKRKHIVPLTPLIPDASSRHDLAAIEVGVDLECVARDHELRRMINLRLQGYSLRTVAQTLGVPLSRVHHRLRALRRELQR